MRRDQFQKGFPGSLTSSTAFDLKAKHGLQERVAVPVEAFVPDPLPPALDWERLLGRNVHTLLEAQAGLSLLEGRARGVVEPKLLMAAFWRREARLSSLIEDTVTTPEKLALAQVEQSSAEPETREVLNYIRALQHGLASKLPLCNRLLCEMHEVLLQDVRGSRDLPGKFRREQNYIGDVTRGAAKARFVPPPPGEPLEVAMRDLERFMNPTESLLPSLVAISLAHYQFECIHPFRDGNGRLGRLLIVLSFCRTGLVTRPWIYVSEYLEANKQEYKDRLLQVSTHGDWESWIEFMLRGFVVSATDAAARVDRILALREDLRGRVTGPRSSALLLRIVDRLFEKPAINVKQACALLGVTHTAVRKHLAKLVALGILEPLEATRREQFWIARQILETSEGVG